MSPISQFYSLLSFSDRVSLSVLIQLKRKSHKLTSKHTLFQSYLFGSTFIVYNVHRVESGSQLPLSKEKRENGPRRNEKHSHLYTEKPRKWDRRDGIFRKDDQLFGTSLPVSSLPNRYVGRSFLEKRYSTIS